MILAQKYSSSRKDELMVNLRAAAIACGVVATCLGGGLGMSYVNSTYVDSTDIVEEVSFVSDTSVNGISETVSDDSAAASEKATQLLPPDGLYRTENEKGELVRLTISGGRITELPECNSVRFVN